MYQSFENRANPQDGPPRLAALRDEMQATGLDGYLVPRADRFQGEYVAPCDERLAWLTGFTGSAGFCAVTRDQAGVFIDGRYRVQVKEQVHPDHFTPVPWPDVKLADWLRKAFAGGGVVGFDPWLHTLREIDTARIGLKGSAVELRATDNLIDRIWSDRPAPPAAPAVEQPIEFTGYSTGDKLDEVAQAVRDAGAQAVVLTLPDSICWLLNIRGADVAHNPVVQAFTVLHADGRVDLFSDPTKFDGLGPDPRISVRSCDAFETVLEGLNGPVQVDRATAPYAVSQILTRADVDILYADDPCILRKARKTDAEISGAADAHLRDGVAMAEFLCWLAHHAPGGGVTEISAAQTLEEYRRATNALRDISFETISATGPHAAIPHYRVTHDSDLPIQPGQLYLVDSGGQYQDGTTDITRTVAIGDVGDDEKASFTRVLRGMIAMSMVIWPRGLAGQHLDAIARLPLWQAGQDFDHGTGHGVGSYLSVHEGPQRLSRSSDVPLQPGMILSNEPGYYREGAFGIRIENLVVVEKTPTFGDGRDMLRFRTLTYAPIDRALIKADMLTADERDWLNAYHADVLRLIGPRVSDETRDWLTRACAPL